MASSYAQIGDVRYAYVSQGEGPLVLFGHGTFGAKELFRPQVEQLAGRFRCVAFDWPGHGQSGYDPGGWTADDLVSQVPALIDALGETTAVLAGVSQGGAIFMRVALKHPQRVRGLVNMCAGPGAPPADALGRMRSFAARLRDETDESLRRRAVDEFVAGSFHAPDFAHAHPQAAAAEAGLILAHPRDAIALAVEVPAGYVTIAGQLNGIACPVLVIWGAHDPRPHLGAEIAAAIPGAQLVVIEDAGHHVNVDAPAETTAAIEQFLRSRGLLVLRR